MTDLGFFDEANVVVVQTDGKILVTGYSQAFDGDSAKIIRYNSDGSLDTSFGIQGVVNIASSPGLFDLGMVVQTDGKILFSKPGAVARYNSDGSLDTAFGVQGFAALPPAISNNEVSLQSDGKIVVTGLIGQNEYVLLRYNADGLLDKAFSGDGEVTVPGSIGFEKALAQSDGKLILAVDHALMRYNSNGSVDTGFGDKGTVTVGQIVDHAVLQADGKIVVVEPYAGNIVRYNSDGSLDAAFGLGGKISLQSSINNAVIGLLPEADGKLVVAEQGTLIRYNIDGSLDSSFGNNGKAVVNFAAISAALQANGDIIVTGSGPTYSATNTFGGNRSDFYTARYHSDGSLDTSFSENVNSVGGGISVYESGLNSVVIAQNAHISDAGLDVLNGGAGNYSGASLILARHGGANAEDVFGAVGSSNLVLSNGKVTLGSAVVGTYQQSGGQLTIAFGAATSQQVNNVLNQLTYTNSSHAAPASIQLDWTFSDGNATKPLSATAATPVTIYPVDDGHSGYVLINGSRVVGQTLTASNNFTDPDGMGTVSYQWYGSSDGFKTLTNLGGEAALVLTQAMTGQQIELIAQYIDGQGYVTSERAIQGTAGNDSLRGDFSNNTYSYLSGLGGNDRLYSGYGNNILDGGAGNDTVDYSYALKSVTVNLGLTAAQNTVGQNMDTLLNIENVYGSLNAANNLTGNAGDNVLVGGKGNDTLNGGAGNDSLNGGAGTDRAVYASALKGVFVNLALTTAQNTLGGGVDTLVNIESLSGSSYNDILIGNSVNNMLLGGNGNDILAGALGDDVLTGGAGQDTFAFNTVLSADNIDTITDFSVADDTVRLAKGIFTTLNIPGVLAADAFKVIGNGGVEDSSDHVLYNVATGALSYDADGSGAGAIVQIALLGKGLAMTNADFVVA
jgi:uncharacterized delta-60 repeat protein